MKRRPTLAGLTMLLVVALAACGGGKEQPAPAAHGGSPTTDSRTVGQQDETVTGLRDGVRHVTRRTARASRPHLVRKCSLDTRKVRHTKRSHGRKKTSYTTKKVRHCHKVRRGTEKYTRILRSERWCVRLDAVGAEHGKGGKDDQWFRVNSTSYGRVQGEEDRAKVTIHPIRQGC